MTRTNGSTAPSKPNDPDQQQPSEAGQSGAKASGFFPKRDSLSVPERARLQIAHVLAANKLEDVELKVDCPSCGQAILVDANDAKVLGAALGWQPINEEVRPRPPEHDETRDVRERHIESVMRTDAPSVLSTTAIGLLPELFERSGAPCVVVVDEDERPLGVASPLDLFREVGTHGPGSIAGLKLLDVSKTQVLYLRTDTRVSSALRLFAEQNPEFIVAVNDAGKFAGVVSPADLLSFLTR
jgi:CBS domain-containing protein